MCVCLCVRVCKHSVMFKSLQPHGLQPTTLSMEFSRQEYWSGLHFLLQGIFPTKRLNSISCIFYIGRQIIYHLPPGKPYKLIGKPHNAGDPGSIAGLERSSGEGSGNPCQESGQGNLMDRGPLRAIGPWDCKKRWTQLSD